MKTRFQKSILAILAVMAVVFAVLIALNRQERGIIFRGAFLKEMGATDVYVFTGEVLEEPVTLYRWYDGWTSPGMVEIWLWAGDRFQDTYLVTYDGGLFWQNPNYPRPESIDIQITKNGETIFEGSYRESMGQLFTPEGVPVPAEKDSARIEGDPWAGYTIPLDVIMELTEGPKIIIRGSWMRYGAMILLTILLAGNVAEPMRLFWWWHRRAEEVPEPGNYYMKLQYVVWVLGTLLLLAGYLAALFAPVKPL